VKKNSLALLFLSLSLIGFFSCKKINEATDIGDGLIPPVDNVNTFEVEYEANTLNKIYFDSTRVGYFDHLAIGHIDDPEFGSMHANFSFNVSSTSMYGTYPFKFPKDTAIKTIDSVVLQLAYAGAYGDTIGNGIQTVSVYQIDQNAGFRADTAYLYNDAGSDFNGSLLGTKTYSIRDDLDSTLVEEPGDTAARYIKNVLRIRLNNSIGDKIASFTTDSGGVNAGFSTDSAFRKLLPGLSVKASNSGNAFAYYNPSDINNTRLIVYYRYKHNGNDTTASVSFVHSQFGQSNFVNVQPGGNWQAAINNSNADKIYLQGSPSGAYSAIKIAGLDTLQNKVIHRAELIAPVVNSSAVYPAPTRLFLDRLRNGQPRIFENDLRVGNDGSVDYDFFGGTQKNSQYSFNITRYVQGIVTRKEPNDTLRIYAPFKTTVFSSALDFRINIPVISRIAEGRVILGGGNYGIPAQRLRLRIIYSNL
jgi:hypothetical protein